MIEKYLKDSIRGKERQAMVEEYTNKVYIPPVMRMAIAKKDSLKRIRENEQLLQQKLRKKEAEDSTDGETPEPEPISVPPPVKKKPVQKRKADTLIAALISDERKTKKTNRS
jgi:penicillin-binding protein 2